MKILSEKRKNVLAVIVLIVLVLAFFSRYLSGKNLFFAADEAGSDLLDFYYPQRAFLAEHLKANQIPFWNPYEENGFPFLAEAQTGIFYPVNLILFRFLDTALAFNWSIITAYLILASGTYFFLKTIRLSFTSALLGSVAVTFSGFFIGHLKHVPLLQAASFLPWVLLFIEKLITTRLVKYMLALSLTFTLVILPGHLPTSYSIIIFSIFYFLLRLRSDFKLRGESLKPIIFFFLSLFFAFSLSAIQLLPTAEMIPFSTRAAPLSTGAFANIPIDQLITFLNPFQFGDPSRGYYPPDRPSFWETIGYIGIIPLLLALSTFFIKTKNASRFKILLLFSLILVLGTPKEFFQPLWNFLPGLTFTRVPMRFLLFTDFSLACLAAFALEKIVKSRIFEIKTLAFALVLITFLDLVYNFRSYNGSLKAESWQTLPQSVKFLQKDSEKDRITNFGLESSYPLIYAAASGWQGDNQAYITGREALPPTLNSLFKIPSIHFQYEYAGSFSLARRSQLSSLTQGAGIMDQAAAKLLGLQNVKYILTMVPLPKEVAASFKIASQYSLGDSLPPMTILENPQVLPRAYLIKNKVILPESKILAFMASEEFDPKSTVVLEEDVPLPEGASNLSKNSVKLLSDGEEKISFAVQAKEPAYFVLTDSFYPGWKAKVDGQETKIVRANYAFRAIPIASGEHDIEFYFEPKSFYLGRIITIVASVSLTVFFLCYHHLEQKS